MRCALLIAFSSVASAAIIVPNPIPVSGTNGFYFATFPPVADGWGAHLDFGGTLGTDSVSVFAQEGNPDMGSLGFEPTSFSGDGCCVNGAGTGGVATIDGISGRFDYMFFPGTNIAKFFAVGNGGGSVEIDDRSGNLLAQANVIAWVDITQWTPSYGCTSDPTHICGVTESFNIVPYDPATVPEPASGVFVGVIAIGVGLAKRSRISVPRAACRRT